MNNKEQNFANEKAANIARLEIMRVKNAISIMSTMPEFAEDAEFLRAKPHLFQEYVRVMKANGKDVEQIIVTKTNDSLAITVMVSELKSSKRESENKPKGGIEFLNWLKGLATFPRERQSKPNVGRTLTLVSWGSAFAVALVIGFGIAVVVPLHEKTAGDAEVFRGVADRQIVLAPDPEERLKQITSEMDRLNIKYQVERTSGRIYLKALNVDPQKEEVANFLEHYHLTPPISSDIVLDIRPLSYTPP